MKSKVATILKERLDAAKVFERRGGPAELAKQFNLSHATLSKQRAALVTADAPPDEEWLVRFAQLAELDDNQIQDLLIMAGKERATTPYAETLWDEIGRRLKFPPLLVSRAVPQSQILRDCLLSLGIDISPTELEGILSPLVKSGYLSDLPMQDFWNLCNQLEALLTNSGRAIEKALSDRLGEALRLRQNLCKIRPLVDFPNAAFVSDHMLELENAILRAMPILPGLLVYFLNFDRGGSSKLHKHSGLECALALKGCATVQFAEGVSYDIDADRHEILLYNCDKLHGGMSEDGAEMLIVHFDGGMIPKWSRIVSMFMGTENQVKCGRKAKDDKCRPKSAAGQ